nr:tetratricopeptide repeat-containing serine protease family protein [uncultured Halomonas sp.]
MLILALAIAQPVAAQSFKPDWDAGHAAFKQKDYATALRHWRPLAKQGDADAQLWLGSMYEYGWGVTKDLKEAVRWYRKAAEQGHSYAQSSVDGLEKQLRAEGNRPPRSRQASKPPAPSASKQQKELERLRREIARLKKEKQAKPKKVAKKPKPSPKTGNAGSGFFISKAGHVITNQHVVSKCKRVTVGDNARKQVTADILETDRSNDLALLKISSTKMASAETKSLMQKLGIKIVPLASKGLMRFEDVELGEDLLVAGYPYGEIFSSTIKVTKGIVSAVRGLGDDSSQFQMDAAVQPGSSGGPIYDGNGNIVGVVIAQLNKLKFAKMTGSMPENVNFGIKASTVRQFLKTSGLPTKWSRRSKPMTSKELAKIAKSQTVMVMCHR